MPKLLITRKTGWGAAYELDGVVGKGARNNPDDVAIVSMMIARIQREKFMFGSVTVMPTRVATPALCDAILAFQKKIQERQNAYFPVDGLVGPFGGVTVPDRKTLYYLHLEMLGIRTTGSTLWLGWPGSLFEGFEDFTPKSLCSGI